MNRFLSVVTDFFIRIGGWLEALWLRFRTLRPRYQWAIGIVLGVVVIGGIALARSGSDAPTADTLRTVVTASIGSLSGSGDGTNVFGTVRSESEAEIVAKAGGTVSALHTSIGASVPAGYVIAELDNASERAAVLSAQGAYEAAQASRSSVSPEEAKTAALNAYRSAYTTLDSTLTNYVDTFFAGSKYHPVFELSSSVEQVDKERLDISNMMTAWRYALDTAESRDPETILNEAEANTEMIADFLTDVATQANSVHSSATPTDLANLAAARSTVDAVLASISNARAAFRANDTGATSLSDAHIKEALGALRGAEANLEKTIVRAPIAGTVNFLPIRVGDYVTPLTHVATVAQNGALEITSYVSEDDAHLLTVGMKVGIEGGASGIITSIAPALDPVTKQIELRIAVSGETTLVNGQSVSITLSNLKAAKPDTNEVLALPLAAVKLSQGSRAVFTVDANGYLVANPIQTGDVRGDRIEVTSSLPADMVIVTDVRGLAEGEKVNVAK